MILVRGGRLWTLGADGSPEPFATGEFVATNGRQVLWERCADSGQCAMVLQTPHQNDQRTFALASNAVGGGWLSPDGAHLARYEGAFTYILDLETGESQQVSNGGPNAWSSDGRYYVYGVGRQVWALDLETDETTVVDFDLLGLTNGSQQLFYD